VPPRQTPTLASETPRRGPFVGVHCRSLTFVVVRCRSLSFAVVRCRSLSFAVVCCRSLSFVVVRCRFAVVRYSAQPFQTVDANQLTLSFQLEFPKVGQISPFWKNSGKILRHHQVLVE
jgi:hypothetical protein